MTLLKSVKATWSTLVVLLTPILLCPLVFPYFETSQESKCASIIILMAVFWITEALPLPVTSLLPIALCPLLGITSSSHICKAFFGDVTFLLVGGIMTAIAIEECGLHKRLALKILMTIGVEPRRLMLGIMLTTAFLSMWISNTATSAMMMPITRALLIKLFSANKTTQQQLNTDIERNGKDPDIRSRDGKSPTEDSIFSFPVNTSLFENKYTFPKEDSSNEESIELHKLQVPIITVLEIRNKSPKQPSNQDSQHRGDHDSAQHEGSGHNNSWKQQEKQDLQDNGVDRPFVIHKEDSLDDNEEDDYTLKTLDPHGQTMLKAFSLCVCYSANIGGMGTLTGTAANMVLSKMAADMSKTSLVTFSNWLGFGFPVSVITLICCYIWMNIYVFGLRNTFTCKSVATKDEIRFASETIKQEYTKLGKIRFNEVIVLIHFLILVLLWLTREPGSGQGWTLLFQDKYVSDGSVAMAIAISLFIFPNEIPNIPFFRCKGDTNSSKPKPSILLWKQVSRKFPWGVLLLLGGGFALSEASKVSGLSTAISKRLLFIRNLPVWSASLVVTVLTSLVTEITSNTVVVMLVLPILKDIAVVLNVNPMYLMLPATLAGSLAFMLPVATPANTLVFSYGDLRIIDMIKPGAVLNVIGVLVIFLAVNTWGYPLFDLGTVPLWALSGGVPGDVANFTISPAFRNYTEAS
uniref:Citrate transporter-like domain-containing protein n=1 Tax=Arion vulgaris TaxID=1028688 RepID=A0A0B7AQT9_9EUPU